MPQKIKPPSTPSKGIYLLTGEDEFRKKLALDKLKEKLLGGKEDTFNYELFFGKDSNVDEIIRSLETLPLTSTRKLVALKDPELLEGQDKHKLLAYLKKFKSAKTILVLVSTNPDADFTKPISKYSNLFDFSKLKTPELSSLIIKEFNARKKNIRYPAAQLICDAAGGDMGRITCMIEQLSVFAMGKDEITDEMIEQFTPGEFSETSTFKLLDSISDKNTEGSVKILKQLLRSESSPSQIVGLLGWHIARVITVKRLLIRKVSKPEMASFFSIGNYILDRLISQAQNFTLAQLRAQLKALLDTDLKIKRSSLKSDFLLEMLVVKLSA